MSDKQKSPTPMAREPKVPFYLAKPNVLLRKTKTLLNYWGFTGDIVPRVGAGLFCFFRVDKHG
jgi:hypothetical protein